MEIKKIYFNMDGVLADFDREVREICGIEKVEQSKSTKEQDDAMWLAIKNADHFYDRLEMMPGAFGMFCMLRDRYGDKVEILTGIPKPHREIETAGEDKISWVHRLLDNKVKVNIVFREDKQNYVHGPGYILIDDLEKDIKEWNEAGDTGILFKSAEEVLDTFYTLYSRRRWDADLKFDIPGAYEKFSEMVWNGWNNKPELHDELEIKDMLIKEMELIRKNDFGSIMYLQAYLAEKMYAAKVATYVRGTQPASIATYVSGITDFLPTEYGLDYRWIYGLRGDREPYFDINIDGPETVELVYNALTDLLGEKSFINCKRDDNSRFPVSFLTFPMDIDKDEAEKIWNEYDSEMIPIAEITKPETFEDFVDLFAMSHGTGVWEENMEALFKEGKVSLNQMLSNRDKLHDILYSYGVDDMLAFEIAEFVRKGKTSTGFFNTIWESYKRLLEPFDLPEWFIESCEKIKYMFPKAHAVSYIVNFRRLSGFKKDFPLN